MGTVSVNGWTFTFTIGEIMATAKRAAGFVKLRGGKTRVNQQQKSRAKKQFLTWLKNNEPFVYRVARRRGELINPQLNGMGAIDWGNLFSQATETIKNLAPAYLQTKQQKQIMDMQMKRAEQGLPPANIIDYTPAIKIEPSITPDTQRAITEVAKDTITSSISKLAIPAAIIGAVLLLKKR